MSARNEGLKFLYAGFVILYLTLSPIVTYSQPESDIDSLKQAITQYKENDTTLLKPWLKLASLLRNAATSEALVYGHKALRMADSCHLTDAKGSAQQILGLIYNTRMDYRNSLFYTFQALRTYEFMGATDGMAYAKNALGLVYYSMKKQDLARQYFSEAITLLKEGGYEKELSIIYNNLGNVSTEEHQIEQSLYYYKMALNNDLKHNNQSNNNYRTYINIGEAYYDLNILDSAAMYLKLALEASTENGRDKYAAAHSYFGLAKVELKRKRIRLADQYLQQALNMAEKGGMNDLLLDVYQTFILLNKEKKDIEYMYEYTQKYDSLKDKVYNETTVKQINEMQETYQVEKRDQQIEILNQKQQVMEVNAFNQRLIRNSAIAGLLLLLTIGIVAARNVVLKQRVKNRMLSEKNIIAENNIIKLNHENVIARYEAMKSKTDPHFLFNSLTTLSSIVMEDPKQAVKYIKQFSHLFRMVLEYSDHKTVTLEKEMEVVNSYIYLQQIRFGDKLQMDMTISDSDKHTFIPPFALQMLVENAVKHNIISNSKPLRLAIYTENNYIIVRNGLQKKSLRTNSTFTGQKSVKERYRILCETQPLFMETATEYIVKLPLIRTLATQFYQRDTI